MLVQLNLPSCTLVIYHEKDMPCPFSLVPEQTPVVLTCVNLQAGTKPSRPITYLQSENKSIVVNHSFMVGAAQRYDDSDE